MLSDNKSTERKTAFNPLQIMGIFWLVFGIVILFSTFFVKATPQVPLIRGIITNIIAGFLLLAAGILSILKAKAAKRREKP